MMSARRIAHPRVRKRVQQAHGEKRAWFPPQTGNCFLSNHVPGGLSPSNLMPHFFAIEACSTAIICPFIWANSAAACLSPPTRNAAGQKMTTAAAVDHWSLVRWLS
jgi:hypothetical protein